MKNRVDLDGGTRQLNMEATPHRAVLDPLADVVLEGILDPGHEGGSWGEADAIYAACRPSCCCLLAYF